MFKIAVSWPWGRDLRAWANDHGHADVEVVMIRDKFGAFDDNVDVVCLAPGPAWIDRALVSALTGEDIVVVGVFDSPEHTMMWESWGVERRMSTSLTPVEQLGLLERLRRPDRDVDTQLVRPQHVGVVDALVRMPLVFGGAPGAGAREVALNLAARYASVGSTVVIDANESGGGVAQRLGYADTPNVLDATEHAFAGRDLREVTSTTILGNPVAFDVIAGLPADIAWTQWPAPAAIALVEAARLQWNMVVVVTSPVIEDLRRWGDRYGVSRTLLSSPSSCVVAVVEASPRGVIRAADWFAQARPVGRVPVIINKVPKRSPHVDAQVRERLVSILGDDRIDIVASLGDDSAVRTAEWNATLATKGRFAATIKSISNHLSTATTERRDLSWQV